MRASEQGAAKAHDDPVDLAVGGREVVVGKVTDQVRHLLLEEIPWQVALAVGVAFVGGQIKKSRILAPEDLPLQLGVGAR